MTSWKGKTKGGLWGHQIFVFILRHLGLSFAYFVLYFVAAWFFLFYPASFRNTFRYLRHAQGFSVWKAFWGVYQTYYRFGQVLLDKVAILAGYETTFTYDFDGKHHLKDMVHNDQAGVLISAHVGNWEVASHFLNELQGRVSVVMFENEHQQIRYYLDEVMKDRKINIIQIGESLEHIFHINAAVSRKDLIAIHGDRFMAGRKTFLIDFMGHPAQFPQGPFLLSARLKVPVAFVYAFKETKRHYHFFARPAPDSLDPRVLADAYAQNLESVLREYPYQWFNFYPFWESFEDSATSKSSSEVESVA